MSDENDVIVEAWNTVLFEKFCRFKHLLTTGLSAHSDNLLTPELHPAGAKVLDVGCGFGDSTIRIAKNVGPEGGAVGMDCAENFIKACEKEAQKEGLSNASFFVGDAQKDDLRGPYDQVFARFGTMFFSFPGAAMNNLRKSLKPGGELTMIVWRKREDNPWLHAAELCVKEIVPVVSHEETNQVHCGPGPFSMAGPDMMSDMLSGVGFERVRFERFDADICIGRDIEECIEFAMALGPAGEIIRLAGDEGVKRKDQVVSALRETMGRFQRDDGIWAPSSTWIISARNPA